MTLPKDLSVLAPEQLLEARAESDSRLAPLFRRWPALSTGEMNELRRLHSERVRLAKHLGFLRTRGLRPEGETSYGVGRMQARTRRGVR